MKYIYEFIGAFFLIFTVGMTVVEPHSAGIMAPLAIGSVLAVMIFAGGYVSGGHYNPAVSLAVCLSGKLSWRELARYWFVQLLGGVAAGYLTLYFKGESVPTPLTLDLIKTFIAEFLFTFALCYVVLNVAIAKGTKGNSFYGLAIGFTVLVGAYAVGSISGAAFNPAVALGMVIMGLSTWSSIGTFFAANLLGGACAAFIFNRVTQKKETH